MGRMSDSTIYLSRADELAIHRGERPGWWFDHSQDHGLAHVGVRCANDDAVALWCPPAPTVPIRPWALAPLGTAACPICLEMIGSVLRVPPGIAEEYYALLLCAPTADAVRHAAEVLLFQVGWRPSQGPPRARRVGLRWPLSE